MGFIRDLSAFEREPNAVVATDTDLIDGLFGDDAVATCHVAELDGRCTGMAIWFYNFSTWRGRPGIYLEDLYVAPSARRSGVANALLQTLKDIALERGCGRIEWSVLDWNVEAQAFYRTVGAQPMDDWTTWRIELASPRR